LVRPKPIEPEWRWSRAVMERAAGERSSLGADPSNTGISLTLAAYDFRIMLSVFR
jgi:hypothetical protein